MIAVDSAHLVLLCFLPYIFATKMIWWVLQRPLSRVWQRLPAGLRCGTSRQQNRQQNRQRTAKLSRQAALAAVVPQPEVALKLVAAAAA